MESVFKLTRAEVELACTQFLRKNGVSLANTAKLVGDTTFEHLHFSGEVVLGVALEPREDSGGAPKTGALDVQAYGAAVERTPVERAPVQRTEVVSALPAPAPAAVPPTKSPIASALEKPVPARPAGSKPLFKEGSFGGSSAGLTGGSPAGMGKQLGKLISSEPPSTVKLPPSVVDFRNKE